MPIPISGLKLLVDLNTLELLEIEDHHDYGHPDVDAEYIPSIRGTTVRTDLKPLHITQPEGASFTVEGTELKWQNWTMRLGFNYREGPGHLPGDLRRPRHRPATSRTGCRSPRWSCPTATPPSTTTGGPPTTSVSGDSGS